MMNAMRYLWCGICACLAAWQPCRGAGSEKEEKKVEIAFTKAGLERSSENGERTGDLQWKCQAVLFIPEPWDFETRSVAERQSVKMWDMDGRELSPVEFHTGWLNGREEKGVSYAEIQGAAVCLPPAGCTQVRMKGSLRVPVVRMLESPVYELPFKAEASSLIPLPGSEEGYARNADDVVKSNELPLGELYVGKCEWKRGDGEKQLALRICLDANHRFRLEKIELLDGKGEVMEYTSPNRSDIDEQSQCWYADFTFSPPEKMDQGKCRVRLIYKTAPEYVTVPVDVRFGVGGEIRAEAEKKAT